MHLHLHNTGNRLMDLIIVGLNIFAWVIVGLYKYIAAQLVVGLSFILPEIPLMSLLEFNEGMHTVVLSLAIVASSLTIFFLLKKNLKK